MVDSVTIQNFRSFNNVKIEDLRRLNILVGENGSGKTALLEALFLAAGVSPELAMRTRRWRGTGDPNQFQGTHEDLYEALWGELFHKFHWNRGAVVTLKGRGEENRSVSVNLNKRGQRKIIPPSRSKPGSPPKIIPEAAPASFKWKVQGYPDTEVQPRIVKNELIFDAVPAAIVRASFYAANRTAPSLEAAQRFSNLSQKFDVKFFLDAFRKVYPQIEDVSIEISVGAPLLFVKLQGLDRKLSLGSASGGMNRLAAILLAIAYQEDGIVLIDELENGLYHRKLPEIWDVIFECAVQYNCQLFISTHSAECLEALKPIAEQHPDDVCALRTVLEDGETKVRRFDGERLAVALDEQIDIR